MGERRKRRRTKVYAGSALVVALLFVLGDPAGFFRVDDRARETAPGGAESENSTGGTPTADRDPGTADSKTGRPSPPVDAELANTGPANPGSTQQGSQSPRPAGESAKAAVPDAADLDRAVGILHRLEEALSGDRLVELAAVESALVRRPIPVPASLADRFAEARRRAAAALDFGDRLRKMVKKGEVLAAEMWFAPLHRATRPSELQARVRSVVAKLGWPALDPRANVEVGGDAKAGPAPFEKLRRARYLRDGVLSDARIWRVGEDRITLRVARVTGHAFPVVPLQAVEVVHPSAKEAYRQGLVAARAGNALGVWLWSCYFDEHGDSATARRLREHIRTPR